MIDWEGLLKFSLKHSDGTSKSEFKEMPAEEQKWLEAALQQYTNSEVKLIQKILQELQGYKEMKEDYLLSTLEELQELLDSLDKGSSLYKMGGHIPLLKVIFYSEFESCRIVALQIYSAANQNDANVQNESINTGALEMMELLEKEPSMKMKENFVGAISATLRGENLEAKRIFIRLHGLQLFEKLDQGASERLKNKMYVLLRDLTFYDDRLHRTHNDLSSFNNTTGVKMDPKDKEYDLKFDPNQELKSKNHLPENEKYKGIVHAFLEKSKEMFVSYLAWLKDRIKEEGAEN